MALGNSGPLARLMRAYRHNSMTGIRKSHARIGPALFGATLPFRTRSETWTMPAVHPKISFASRNGSQKSRRQKPRNPMTPIARFAPATSC